MNGTMMTLYKSGGSAKRNRNDADGGESGGDVKQQQTVAVMATTSDSASVDVQVLDYNQVSVYLVFRDVFRMKAPGVRDFGSK